MNWTNATLTNAGRALLAAATAGDIITITRAVSGAGSVIPALLGIQTDVTDIKQTLSLGVITTEAAVVSVPIILNNVGLETGYTLWQVGVFAKKNDEAEVLLFIAQSTTGDPIPPESVVPNVYVEIDFKVAYSSEAAITVVADPAGPVTRQEHEEDVAALTITVDDEQPSAGWWFEEYV